MKQLNIQLREFRALETKRKASFDRLMSVTAAFERDSLAIEEFMHKMTPAELEAFLAYRKENQ